MVERREARRKHVEGVGRMWELTVYAYRVENYANEATKKIAGLSLTVQEFAKLTLKRLGSASLSLQE